MNSIKKKNNVNWIYLVIFLDFFAVSLVLPSMSMYLKNLGASYSMIGAMSSTYAFTQLISGPIIGSLSDRMGRKNILLISCLIIGCCYSAVGLLSSLFIILLLRATIGVFKHTQVLIRAIIVDQVAENQQPLIFGRLKSVIGISFSLGPIIGGHLTEIDGGFTYVALTAGILFGFNTVVVYLFFNETLSDIKKPNVPDEKPQRLIDGMITAVDDLKSINWLIFGDVFILKFMSSLASVAYYSNYNLRLQARFDVSPKVSGYTIAFQSMIGVLTGFLISKINDKFYTNDVNYKKRNTHSFMLMTLTYSLSYLSPNLMIFLISGMFFQIAHMILRVSLTNVVIQRSPVSKQGSVAGFDQSIISIARMITPLTVGIIEDMFGSSSGILLSIFTSIIGLFVSLTFTTSHIKAS